MKNAILSQLTKLERHDLVQAVGKRSRVWKPETVYELADEAEKIFPRAYDVLFRQLIRVLEKHDEMDAEALCERPATLLAEMMGLPVQRACQVEGGLCVLSGTTPLESAMSWAASGPLEATN